ncbi:MAG: hypothetical protein ACREJC_00425, partial [Tepidisphaeraceae bacterium]
MNPKVKKIAKFVVRWGIAVAGIGWVLSNMSLFDRVLIEDPQTGRPMPVLLAKPATEDAADFYVMSPYVQAGKDIETPVPRQQLFVRAGREQVVIRDSTGGQRTVDLVGLKVTDNPDRATWPLVVG